MFCIQPPYPRFVSSPSRRSRGTGSSSLPPCPPLFSLFASALVWIASRSVGGRLDMEGAGPGAVRIDVDKLPIKRLDAIEESGAEHFPPEMGYEEKRLHMVRRVDFSSVVDKDSSKKQKKSSKEPTEQAWPWQGLVENLRLAHQELSIIIDLIVTVEANDVVSVAGMQRPKQLPNELLSDLAVSAATKLQRLRHLGRYFKQSSKALEQQVTREGRFYGSLIRLQQNWKVKRQRLAASGPGSDGFTIDLLDTSLPELAMLSRPSSLATVHVDHDSVGMLAVQQPLRSCRFICLRFLGTHLSLRERHISERKLQPSGEVPSREGKKEALTNDDVNECIKDTHSMLREIHQSIFEEQVFDMVNRETFNPSPGVNITGMREDFLQLGIGQETSICLSLESRGKEDSFQVTNSAVSSQEGGGVISHAESLGLMTVDKKHGCNKRNVLRLPNPFSLEIYLEYIFHESTLVRTKERQQSGTQPQVSGQHATGGHGLLGHFCMTISHRIFSSKVLSVLECLVDRVPYLHLLSHPTWYSRTSSWSLLLKVPQSILHSGRRSKPSDARDQKSGIRLQFHTKVLVNDDQISVSGEGAPNIIGSFRGSSMDICTMNSYGCDLEDLPMILLQQVASQVICWLHEEALEVGMKVNKDFLCMYFELDQGDALGLVAHVDPDDMQGCISWWVVMDNGSMEEKLSANDAECENRRFLGHLSLEALYSTLMDLVSFCSAGGSH